MLGLLASGNTGLRSAALKILMQMPDSFMRKVADEAGFGLPELGAYSSGLVFFSCIDGVAGRFEESRLIGWNDLARFLLRGSIFGC